MIQPSEYLCKSIGFINDFIVVVVLFHLYSLDVNKVRLFLVVYSDRFTIDMIYFYKRKYMLGRSTFYIKIKISVDEDKIFR